MLALRHGSDNPRSGVYSMGEKPDSRNFLLLDVLHVLRDPMEAPQLRIVLVVRAGR